MHRMTYGAFVGHVEVRRLEMNAMSAKRPSQDNE